MQSVLPLEKKNNYIEVTRQWLEHFVIGLNLCPFAQKPFSEGKIRYVLYEGQEQDEIVELFLKEAHYLNAVSNKKVETTLLIHPHFCRDFYNYLDWIHLAEELLKVNNLEGHLQIASFHPDYQFAGTHTADVENYTNRSPFPMIHLLREESIEQALQHFAHPERIPETNIRKMKEMGEEAILKILKS